MSIITVIQVYWILWFDMSISAAQYQESRIYQHHLQHKSWLFSDVGCPTQLASPHDGCVVDKSCMETTGKSELLLIDLDRHFLCQGGFRIHLISHVDIWSLMGLGCYNFLLSFIKFLSETRNFCCSRLSVPWDPGENYGLSWSPSLNSLFHQA